MEREAVLNLQESMMEKEWATFEKGQHDAEAYKAAMRQRVEATEQAERCMKGHLRDYKECRSSKDKSDPSFFHFEHC